MKRFRTLEIKNAPERIELLLDKLKKAKGYAFSYDEKKSKMTDPKKGGIHDVKEYAIFHSDSPNYYKSDVFVMVRDGFLEVVNITSQEKDFSSLGIANYNFIITSFFYDFIANFIDASFSVSITGDEVSIKDKIGEEAYKALESWSDLCNKTSPFVHQYDLERWFEFIWLVFKNHIQLSTSELEQWLTEEKDWSPILDDVISDITSKYEYSLDLLSYVNNKTNS